MNNTGSLIASAALFGAALVLFSTAAVAEPIDDLKACAQTADAAARFACYEELGQRLLDAETTAEEAGADSATVAEVAAVATIAETAANETLASEVAASETTTAASADEMPSDLGGSEFSETPDEVEEGYTGQLVDCQKGPDKKWYYVFDNGQVWKQVNAERLRYDDCTVGATISKDMFGYKILVEGKKGKVRVSRRK